MSPSKRVTFLSGPWDTPISQGINLGPSTALMTFLAKANATLNWMKEELYYY